MPAQNCRLHVNISETVASRFLSIDRRHIHDAINDPLRVRGAVGSAEDLERRDDCNRGQCNNADGGPKILQDLVAVWIVDRDVAVPVIKRKRDIESWPRQAAGFGRSASLDHQTCFRGIFRV